jgi:DNA replication protein DnaC
VLTYNRGFDDWNHVFADAVAAGAIVDRLLHTATVMSIRGARLRNSRRCRQAEAQGGSAMVA